MLTFNDEGDQTRDHDYDHFVFMTWWWWWWWWLIYDDDDDDDDDDDEETRDQQGLASALSGPSATFQPEH